MTDILAPDVASRQGAWHQSTLELIGNCSWRYFLTYVLGLPDPSGEAARNGTAVHSAVELHESMRRLGQTVSLDDMIGHAAAAHPDADVDVIRCGATNWWRAVPKAGGTSHRDWLAEMQPVAVEEYFNHPLVDGCMPIGGTIDGVYLHDGRYRVVDLKTASSMARWKDSGEGKRLQATMYAVAVQLRFQLDYLPDVTYTVVRTTGRGETSKRVHVQPDLEDVRVLGERIRVAQHTVDTEDYVRNPAWVLCSAQWCPHHHGCMETGRLSGTPVTVRQRLSQDKVLGPHSNT